MNYFKLLVKQDELAEAVIENMRAARGAALKCENVAELDDELANLRKALDSLHRVRMELAKYSE